jgi:hypothetical protein
MKAFSRLSRFGMTCEPLTENLGAELLTWFLEASRAKILAPLATVPESKEAEADYGASLPGSFAKWDRDSRSWKTHQCLLLGGWESFSETWPRWGMMRAGACWERSTPALLTSASESGLLPTPLANNTKAHHMRSGGRPGRSYWPTHVATDGSKGGRVTPRKSREGGNLIEAVSARMWPIPTVFGNYNRKGVSPQSGDGLATAVKMYPTPCANEDSYRLNGNSQQSNSLGALARKEAINEGNDGGQLNPTWVEWLMGWPLGWTDLKPSETDKFQQWRHSHGKF